VRTQRSCEADRRCRRPLWKEENHRGFGVHEEKKRTRIVFFFFKEDSPAVFDPDFSAGRWANAEVGT